MLMRTDRKNKYIDQFNLLGFIIGLAASHGAVFAEPTTISQESAVITTDTTWTLNGSPYTLTRDVEVRPQATLTIEAGVEIRFGAVDQAATGDPDGIELLVRGRLMAMGTAVSPVRMNGQDLAGPADHATGIRFAQGALGSTLNHVQINGLAYGVDQVGDMSLAIQGLSINANKIAFRRATGGSDLVFENASLVGGESALDLAALEENVFIRLNGCGVEGDIVLKSSGAGAAGFGSELSLTSTQLQGSVKIEGNLLANSKFMMTSSTLSSGWVKIDGDVNTGARIHIENSHISPTGSAPALMVSGSLLSDSTVDLLGSNLNGSIKLGAAPEMGGAGEGQFFLIDTPSTWADAAASCAARGGKLADSADINEARSIFSSSQGASTDLVWIGGTLTSADCTPAPNYVDLPDSQTCRDLDDLGVPVKNITRGYGCACNLNCNLETSVRETCFPSSFSCLESVTYQARLPACDSASQEEDYCYGDRFAWEWESGEALDQTAAQWGMGEADRLTCLGASPNLNEELHIAVDLTDSTGSVAGELGLWRTRTADQLYSYVCEGSLAVPSAQEVSRGTVSLHTTSVDGALEIRAGQVSIESSEISSETRLVLFRDGSIHSSHFEGSINIASRKRVEVSASQIMLTVLPNGLSSGGGIQVESEHAVLYGNVIDGGSFGVVARGTAEVSNNLITRMSGMGIQALPQNGLNVGLDTQIGNNTLVDNHTGIYVEGLINAPTTRVHNNNVVRGEGVGMRRSGAIAVVPNNNNVFGYDTLYSNFTPDVNSVNANPGFVADFPSAEPIFRLSSGSPLIDIGRCDLAPFATALEGGLRVDIEGIPRPFDGDFAGGAQCDIGAYEFGPEEIFMYVDGVLATSESFSTGIEVDLTLMGRRDSNIFPVSPAVWTIDPSVGIFNEATDQFRPSATPGFYSGALHAQFGNLTTSLDVDLGCGCQAPDEANGAPGECNGVPSCYFDDWTCPVRENYCQVAEMGSFENPLTIAAEETKQIRAGARDPFGFVFKHAGPFTYQVINGGGSVNAAGQFTAASTAGDYVGTLRIASGAFSGVTDVRVVPNAPHEIVISKATASVSTTRTLLYTAVVKDAFNNVIPEAQVTWSIGAAGGATIDPVTGRVTAGCAPGTYANTVTATFGGVSRSADLIVDQGGAILTDINLSTSSLTIPATTQVNFTVTVTDACGFTRPANNPVFTSNGTAGAIDGTGVFTAGCQLGSFGAAITVTAETLSTSVNISVTSAPLSELNIQPNDAQMRMGTSLDFEAVGIDTCGRLKTVQPVWSTTVTNGTTSEAGLAINRQRLTLPCSIEGKVFNGLIAEYTDEYNRNFLATANVEVLAGEVATLTLPEANISLPAGNQVQLQANAEDACGNSRNDAIRWSASNGSVHPTSGLYTAGCDRGDFPNAIFAQAGTRTAQFSVEVTDGVLNSIQIVPSPVVAQAGTQRQLTAQLFDGCGNLIDRDPVWRSAAGGSLTPTGLLTASEEARTYFGAIIAELDGIQQTADLEVTPAAASTLELTPDPFVVAAGSTTSVEVTAYDVYGNPFTPEVNWTVNPNAGAIDEDNDFIAGQVVGTYPEGLIARVGAAELSIDVEIVPAAVSALNIQPSPLFVSANSSVQLNAQPVDRFNNPVPNTTITWSVEAGGGQVSSTGLFTAGTRAGVFTGSLVASGGGVTQRITVNVLPGVANRLVLTPSPLQITPQEERQLSLEVYDQHLNPITPSEVVFAISSGNTHFTVSPTGLVRGRDVAGSGSIQVNANGLSSTVNVEVTPGPITQIEIRRPVQNELVIVEEGITVTPGAVVDLTATAMDAFENPVDVPLTWSTSVEGFGVTNAGVFTAGLTAGSYPSALRVRHLNVIRLINVTVVPGPAVALHIEPAIILTSPGQDIQLSAHFTDTQGNRIAANNGLTWRVIAASSNLAFETTGLLRSDCDVTPAVYSDSISVEAIPPGGVAPLTGLADVEVVAGETSNVSFEVPRVEVIVTSQVTLRAYGEDLCGYRTGDVPRYQVVSGGGAMSSDGTFTAGTVAEVVMINASIRDASAQAQAIVKPGPAVHLRINPRRVSVTVADRQDFNAEAEDQFGNVWSPSNAIWSVRAEDDTFDDVGEVGEIDSQGSLRAATTAGTYLDSIKVMLAAQGPQQELESFAEVILDPASPSEVIVTPADAVFIPNQIQSFTATILDDYDNEIRDIEAAFEVALPEAGFITDGGLFTATDRIGTYQGAINAYVQVEGERVAQGQANVTVVNSEPAQVIISPDTITLSVGSVTRFTAVVLDTEGVEIERASVMWSLSDADLGEIILENSGEGRLSVGRNPDRYFGAVVATVLLDNGLTLQGSADVIVPRDFDEDGIDDVLEFDRGLNPDDPEDANLDPDEDGLTNADEVAVGLDYNDADSDDDGILDGDEEGWGVDTDGDGDVNALDSDSDGDGIPDGVERGVTQPTQDTQASNFTPDADPQTTTDPLLADTDGDGINDGDEDTNLNGRLDPGETPPNRDLNTINCDASLEETGCPSDLVCLNSVCTMPLPEAQPEPDQGCQSSGSRLPMWALLISCALLIGTRRRLIRE